MTIILINRFWSKRIDIHRLARDKMFYAAFDLRRTSRVIGAIVRCLALISHQFGTTLRTMGDELYTLGNDGTLVSIHPHDFRYDLSAFLHIDIIADVKVETADEIFIIQCGTFHGCASQQDRIHVRYRGNGTRSTHLIGHRVQPCQRSLCLEFIGNSPSRTLGSITKSTLLTQGVYFENDTVGGNGQVFAFCIPVFDEFENLLKGFHLTHSLTDFESP